MKKKVINANSDISSLEEMQKQIDLLYSYLVPLYEGHTAQDRLKKAWEECKSKIEKNDPKGRQIELEEEKQ